MGGYAPRALEDSVHPRRLSDVVVRPLNFTVSWQAVMTVADPNVVDFIAHRDDVPIVRLVISDHLEWAAKSEHLHALQQKLNKYLAFVESGELVRKYPSAAAKQIQIEVAFLHQPPEHALRHFLEPARDRIQKAGLGFAWRVGRAS